MQAFVVGHLVAHAQVVGSAEAVALAVTLFTGLVLPTYFPTYVRLR